MVLNSLKEKLEQRTGFKIDAFHVEIIFNSKYIRLVRILVDLIL
jgi:hypothetical protein